MRVQFRWDRFMDQGNRLMVMMMMMLFVFFITVVLLIVIRLVMIIVVLLVVIVLDRVDLPREDIVTIWFIERIFVVGLNGRR